MTWFLALLAFELAALMGVAAWQHKTLGVVIFAGLLMLILGLSVAAHVEAERRFPALRRPLKRPDA